MNRLIVFALLTVAIVAFIAPSLGSNMPVASASSSADTASHGPNRSSTVVDEGDETVIERDSSGQFHISADVDGAEVKFLVDTGADVVALTLSDAEIVGLNVDPESFQPIMRTASGTGYGAPVRIERLTIGGRDLDNVDAVVMRDLPVSLLGQSVLGRLGSVSLQGDRLVITG
jgi:aspartyl protease family protein